MQHVVESGASAIFQLGKALQVAQIDTDPIVLNGKPISFSSYAVCLHVFSWCFLWMFSGKISIDGSPMPIHDVTRLAQVGFLCAAILTIWRIAK